MGKVVLQFDTKYDIGDIVIFKKSNIMHVGIVEGYYIDCDTLWYNIRINKDFVFSYSQGGDIQEDSIHAKLKGDLAQQIRREIMKD